MRGSKRAGRARTMRAVLSVMVLLGMAIASLSMPSAALADGGDFTVYLYASEPTTYDHATGGGALNDGTVGEDIVNSLEGGDFTCEDIVSFLTHIIVDDGAAPDQQIQIIYGFLGVTTGQPGVGFYDVVGVSLNSAGDAGYISTDDDETVELFSETLPSDPFNEGTTNLQASVRVGGLDATEEIIVRIDVRIGCAPDPAPTGNLGAGIDDAAVIAPPEEVDDINLGQQSVPTQNVDDIAPGPTLVGSITIVKDTQPDVDQRFIFTGDLGLFSLVDDGSGAPKSTSFTTVPGAIVVTEPPLAPGWKLTNISCTGDDDNGSTVDLPARSVTIDLDAGETIVCTFTNTVLPGPTDPKPGSISGIKQNGAGVPIPDWTINLFRGRDSSGAPDASTTTGVDGVFTFENLVPGPYTICEELPSGATQLEPVLRSEPRDPGPVACDNGTVGYGVSVSSGDSVIGLVFINVLASDPLSVTKTVTATFDQDYDWAIEKSVTPDAWQLATGDSGTSTYTVSATRSGPFSSGYTVSGAITIINENAFPVAVVSVVDTLTPGAIAAAVTCPVVLPVTLTPSGEAGDTLVCTYLADEADGLTGGEGTNTVTVTTEAGVANGSDAQPVTYTLDQVTDESITVEDTNGQTFPFSDTGEETYSVDFICDEDEGAHVNTITAATSDQQLSDDATVTVDCPPFEEPGTIIIRKDADPDDQPWEFIFHGPDSLESELLSGGSSSATLPPGTHVVSEDLTEIDGAWLLTDITCEVGDSTYEPDLNAGSVEINLAAGDTVDCTFFNEAQPDVVIPEAPFAILFPLIGLLVAAAGYLVWRRRTQAGRSG